MWESLCPVMGLELSTGGGGWERRLGASKLGADVTHGKDAVTVTGRGWCGVDFSLNSGVSISYISHFLLLMVETPESFELRVDEGKSTLVSRKPAQISLTLI